LNLVLYISRSRVITGRNGGVYAFDEFDASVQLAGKVKAACMIHWLRVRF
jgi:hypothetical protein